MAQFWATEAALGMAMLAYNLMSLFRQAVMKSGVHHMLATLHHKVFAVGTLWDSGADKISCDWLCRDDKGNGLKGYGLKLQSIQACIGSGMNEEDENL